MPIAQSVATPSAKRSIFRGTQIASSAKLPPSKPLSTAQLIPGSVRQAKLARAVPPAQPMRRQPNKLRLQVEAAEDAAAAVEEAVVAEPVAVKPLRLGPRRFPCLTTFAKLPKICRSR